MGDMLRTYKKAALRAIEKLLCTRGVPFSRLPEDQVQILNLPEAETVWETTILAAGRNHRVYILVDGMLPFSRPIIAVADPELVFLKYPHIEENGVMCLVQPHVPYSLSADGRLLAYLLKKATVLLENGATDANQKDFADEFLNYWGYSSIGTHWAFVEISPPSRQIVYCEREGIFFEDADFGEAWLTHLIGPEANRAGYSRTAFLWLKEPLLPETYPEKNRDVIAMAEKNGDSDMQLLTEVLETAPNYKPIIIGFMTDNGPALAGMTLKAPTAQATPRGKRRRNTAMDGFRPGKLPKEQVLLRYKSASADITRNTIQRVDPEWIHSRGGDGVSEYTDKSVCVLGCGSVGAHVAFLLAQAGIGKLILVDPDKLSWDNVARHILGGKEFIGKKKADALATHLNRHLPHILVDSCGEKRLEDLVHESPSSLTTCDIVVSMMGSWGAECALNYFMRTTGNSCCPVIYGWTEAHACAGHSLLVMKKGGCLTCGMSPDGDFKSEATLWPNKKDDATMKREPACGAYYAPYGAVAVTSIQAMIAGHVLDTLAGRCVVSELRTWLGPSLKLRELGGKWTKAFVPFTADGTLDRSIAQEWKKSSKCNLC